MTYEELAAENERLRARVSEFSDKRICLRCKNPWTDYCDVCWADKEADKEHSRSVGLSALKSLGSLLRTAMQERDAARLERDKALEKAEIYEKDWYEAKSEFGTSMAKMREQLREQKSEFEATLEKALQATKEQWEVMNAAVLERNDAEEARDAALAEAKTQGEECLRQMEYGIKQHEFAQQSLRERDAALKERDAWREKAQRLERTVDAVLEMRQ